MNKILKKTYFSEKVVQMVVEAPLIAKSRKPGNFVIVRVGEKGERMPLTISDADPVKGTITLVIQKMGVSSTKLCNLEEGEYITDLVGPLGKATHIEKVGTVLACGGGVGVAPLLPIIRAFKAAGNRVVSILAIVTTDVEARVRRAEVPVIARGLRTKKTPAMHRQSLIKFSALRRGYLRGLRPPQTPPLGSSWRRQPMYPL